VRTIELEYSRADGDDVGWPVVTGTVSEAGDVDFDPPDDWARVRWDAEAEVWVPDEHDGLYMIRFLREDLE